MDLDTELEAAVRAIRELAGSLAVIARRRGWRVATAVNDQDELVIAVLIPAEHEGEWAGVPRTRRGTLVPLEQCPGPVAAIGWGIQRVVTNRGLHCELQVFEREIRSKTVWLFALAVPEPSLRQQLTLKHRR